MIFVEPLWLLVGCIACVALIWSYRRSDQRQRAALTTFASSHLLGQLTVSFSTKRRACKRLLFVAGTACVFLGLARPQWGFRWEETKRKGIDIVFAVDTSKSMLAQDVKPNRITRAKLAVSDLVDKLGGDRVGLIAFAGNAFLQSPLTLDYDAFRQSLDALEVGIIPRGGTDVASAIQEAKTAFGPDTKSQKILVLITDGEDLESKGIDAAKAAAKDGLKIYTIGVGGTGGELIPVPDENGGTSFLKDESGNYVKSRLDENTLKRIAEATGAVYAPLGQQGQGLQTVYQHALAPLPKQDLASRMQKVMIERFQWPLALGIVLLAAEMLISTRKNNLRRRFVPLPAKRSNPKIHRAPRLEPVAVAGLALCMMVGVVHASPQSAEAAYKNGNYPSAATQYRDAAKRDPKTSALQFNLGTAAYKNGQYDQALPAFQRTLATDKLPLQQQAYYNLGNTQYRVGEKTEKTQPQETIKTWEGAVASYDAALKLNAADPDAKFNRDFVQKKLDQLKQQQQQKQDQQKQQDKQDKDPQQNEQNKSKQPNEQNKEQKQDKNQQPNKDQQQNNSAQGKRQQNKARGQSSEDQPSKNEPNQDQQDEKKQEQASDSQPKDQSQQNKGGQPPKPDQRDANGQPHLPGDQPPGASPTPSPNGQPQTGAQMAKNGQMPSPTPDEPKSNTAPMSGQGEQPALGQPEEQREAGQMSPQEAKALLDSTKKDERALPTSPDTSTNGQPQPETPRKDW